MLKLSLKNNTKSEKLIFYKILVKTAVTYVDVKGKSATNIKTGSKVSKKALRFLSVIVLALVLPSGE